MIFAATVVVDFDKDHVRPTVDMDAGVDPQADPLLCYRVLTDQRAVLYFKTLPVKHQGSLDDQKIIRSRFPDSNIDACVM